MPDALGYTFGAKLTPFMCQYPLSHEQINPLNLVVTKYTAVLNAKTYVIMYPFGVLNKYFILIVTFHTPKNVT
jgi:hypothetical protein